MRLIKLFILLIFTSFSSFAQDNSVQKEKVKVVGEDSSTPGYVLKDVVIKADNREYLKKYRNTRYFVRRVYEYSQLASAMLNEYQDTLTTMHSERAKRRFLKKANKELKAEFGDEIKNMSVTRGRFLNKLIYRETGLTTYDIIRDYRGGVKAIFFQSLCRLNGQNLKISYDPSGEDAIIERVIREIETGKIKTIPRSVITQKAKDIQKRKKAKKKHKKKKPDLAAR